MTFSADQPGFGSNAAYDIRRNCPGAFGQPSTADDIQERGEKHDAGG